mmetsp:Transcript_139109/g.443935  ORF Transcript_139109/g.443935 Transcript_139109/m.443935 type:complete len:84 (+) Transcript_139109:167-418(+)
MPDPATCEAKCRSAGSSCVGIAFNEILNQAGAGHGKPGYCSVYSDTKPDEKMSGPFDDGALEIASADGQKFWKCYRAVNHSEL